MRRFFIFDKFNTWADWRLTLTAKDVTAPEPKTNYVQLDGMSGSLDLTEALTGGVTYNDRTVTASFWTSEGTAQERVTLLRNITAALHGKKVKIIEPDDPTHFFVGRAVLKSQVRDQVHTEFTVEATCEPWRYAVNETERRVDVSDTVDVVLKNDGVKTLTPTVTLTAPMTLTFGGSAIELQAGSYRISGLRLSQGVNVVSVSGTGSITFTYREAEL